ncbi:MAG: beta-mannosidase [Frankiales bacterium]|nr:beta-mannosidase [Frankiales bacterium]
MTQVTRGRVQAASAVAIELPTPDGEWLEVPLPFDLHRVLERAGRLAPVDYGLNVEAAEWVEEEAWWCVLDLPEQAPLEDDERLQLVLEGLDTVVEVWVDGEHRASHANMYRPVVLDLAPESRRVHLRFEAFAKCPPMVSLRKAPFSAGWDFAPRRPGVGVWQPVNVDRQRHGALGPPGFRTVSLAQDRAQVEVDLDVESWTDAALELEIALAGPDGTVLAAARAAAQKGRTTVALTVEQPQLWWTHDLGEPALHQLHVTLLADDQEVDVRDRAVGIRTVALDRTDGAFQFRLNDVPVNVRGVNWVPCGVALAEIPADAYRPLLERVREANGQLVRVWGGGIYEAKAFYDDCDQLGILVWQDFMFACADYRDDDPLFVEDVLVEATYHVRRLRAHPSLALWCGNNEVELLAGLIDWTQLRPAERLFDELLAAVVEQESPGTAYTSSSPVKVNNQKDGDRHSWEVWHGLAVEDEDRTWSAWSLDEPVLDPMSPEAADFAARAGAHRYLDDTCRFVSEYGLCGMPALETLATWTEPAALKLGDRQVTHRQRSGKLGPVNKLEIFLAANVGTPADLAEHVRLSQLLQAEGLKTGAEHYRRQWPHCGGQIIWQLDDCWPAVSWSLIDIAGRTKPAYYAMRRAYVPVLASFRATTLGADLWLTNNSRYDVTDDLEVALQSFAGEQLQTWSVPASAAAGTSGRLLEIEVDERQRHDAYLHVRSGGAIPDNRLLLATMKDLDRPRPSVRVSTTTEDGWLVARLESDALALMVHVDGADWEDDYVDVHPGRPVLLHAPLPAGLRAWAATAL